MTTFEQILSTVTQQSLYGKYTAMTVELQSAFMRYTSPDAISEKINRVKSQTPINELTSVSYIIEDVNTNTLELHVDKFRRLINYELVWTKTDVTARWGKTESGYALIDDNYPATSVIKQKIGDVISHMPRCYYVANTGTSLTSVNWSWVTIEGLIRTDSLVGNGISYICSLVSPVSSDKDVTSVMSCGVSCNENTVFLTDSPCFC